MRSKDIGCDAYRAGEALLRGMTGGVAIVGAEVDRVMGDRADLDREIIFTTSMAREGVALADAGRGAPLGRQASLDFVETVLAIHFAMARRKDLKMKLPGR